MQFAQSPTRQSPQPALLNCIAGNKGFASHIILSAQPHWAPQQHASFRRCSQLLHQTRSLRNSAHSSYAELSAHCGIAGSAQAAPRHQPLGPQQHEQARSGHSSRLSSN